MGGRAGLPATTCMPGPWARSATELTFATEASHSREQEPAGRMGTAMVPTVQGEARSAGHKRTAAGRAGAAGSAAHVTQRCAAPVPTKRRTQRA